MNESNLIVRSWKGWEELWKVFWLYVFLFGLIGSFVADLLPQNIIIAWVYFIFSIVYFIWGTVSLWRCAFNAGNKIWGYLVRILVVLQIAGYIFALLVGGLLVGVGLMGEAERGQYEQKK